VLWNAAKQYYKVAPKSICVCVNINEKPIGIMLGVPTQTCLRPVTTCVCKPEAANKVRTPDDERYAARNMLSLQ
jgi:hypothetical protein